jgi:hypothetical protein
MAQLSRTSSEFDRFLFAPLHENGETPLSVLSALARQDVDAWQEAARLARLPKDHAVNSLASTIWKSDSERWSPSEASILAARLVELLPSPHESRESPVSMANETSKLMMTWLAYGIIFGSIAISGNINQRSGKYSDQPDRASIVAEQQQQIVSPPSRDANAD